MRRPELLQSALLAAVLALTACGKKEEEAAAPPPPPPPKQEVKVESVADVMKRLAIDSRVKMDESERPTTGDAGGDLKRLEATLLFFNAMVKGDATKLKPMLSEADQTTLDLMQRDGQWKRATDRIDRVTVGCTGGQEPETFMALGWKGPDGNPFDMQSYVGKWARVLVENFKKEGSDVTRSAIGKVKPFEGAVPVDGVPENPAKAGKAKSEEYLAKVATAKKQLENEELSPKGYDILLKSLKAEYGVLD